MGAGENKTVSIVISAVDGVTAKVRAINQKLAGITAPIRKINNSFRALADESGVGKFSKAFSEVQDKAGKVGKEMRDVFARIAGTVTLATVAIYELTHGFSEQAEGAAHAAVRLGTTATKYQELMGASRLVLGETETFSGALNKFSKNIGEAATGTGDSVAGFYALGITLRGADGHVRKFDQILPEVAEKLSRIHNASVRNAVGAKLFGKQFEELVPIFEGGKAGLEELGQKATELGYVLSDEDVAGGSAMQQIFNQLSVAAAGVRNTIAAALLPVVKDLSVQLLDFFKNNRDQIAEWAKQFAQAIPGIVRGLREVFQILHAFATPLIAISRHFGAVQTAATILAVVIGGKLIFAIYSLMGALVQLGLISAVTPIGLIAIAIGAVIAAFAALYIWWEPIKQFFHGLSNEAFLWGTTLVGLVGGPIGDFLGVAALILRHWEPVKAFFESLWKVIGQGSSILSAAGRLAVGAAGGPVIGAALGIAGAPLQAAQLFDRRNDDTPNRITGSEAQVRVIFDNLPHGSRVDSDSKGVPLDVDYGLGLGRVV